MKKVMYLAFAILLSGLTASAADHKNPVSDTTKTKKTKFAVQYVCPMHPDEVSNKPGRCHKCGMDLVKKEIATRSKTESTKMKMKM